MYFLYEWTNLLMQINKIKELQIVIGISLINIQLIISNITIIPNTIPNYPVFWVI